MSKTKSEELKLRLEKIFDIYHKDSKYKCACGCLEHAIKVLTEPTLEAESVRRIVDFSIAEDKEEPVKKPYDPDIFTN